MDKMAKLLRDHFNIPYTGALDIKKAVFAQADFREKLAEYRASGRKMEDLVVDLATPIIEARFEPNEPETT